MVAKFRSPSRSAVHLRSAAATLVASVALAAGLPLATASAAVAVTLYASPEVSDGSGRSCTTVEDACSLFDARDKVRTLNSNMTGDIVVKLLGGTYQLPYTWWITERATVHDSGTNGFNVIYENYGTDVPILSGGRTITGWTVFDSAKGIYSAPAPAGVNSRQLYVNGLRQTRARGVPTGTWTRTSTGFNLTDGAVSTYKNVTGVELVGSQFWMQSRCPLASATATSVTVAQPCWRNSNQYDWGHFPERPTWIENAYELIDQPGEWYLDRTGAVAGNGQPRIYLKPVEAAKLATSKVVLPALETLLSLTGTSANRLHNVQFKGIRFEYATWLRPGSTEGYASRQTGYLYYGPTGGALNSDLEQTPGNVDVREATDIRFEGDTFTRLGAVGLSVTKGTQDIAVVGNRFEDISGSAVSIGHFNDHHPANTGEYVKNVSFTDNLVTRIGAEYQDQSAVTAAYPQYTDVSYNEIFDVPYTGISMGIGWGRNDPDPIDKECTTTNGTTTCQWNGFTTPTPLRNNTVTHNYIHEVMRDMEDGGAIYTESDQPGSVISDNYLRNPDAWFGVYMDNGTQHYSVTNNVIAGFANWVALNSPDGNNSVTSNYADAYGDLRNWGVNNTVSGNVSGLTSWPAAAQSIIAGAGIRPAYAGVKQTNLALNATVTATSSVGANWAPSYANDGRVRTDSGYTQRWLGAGPAMPQTLSLDLGRQYSLSSIKQTTSETDGSTSNYKLEGSVDNNSWVTLADHTGTAVPNGTRDTVSGTYRYVRMTVTGVANGHWASSNEFEVYGTPPWDNAHGKWRVKASSGSTASVNNAVDGLLDTAWIAPDQTFPQSYTVDFRYQHTLRVVRQIVSDTDSSQYKYKIEGSNDVNVEWNTNPSLWTTLVDHTTTARPGRYLVDVLSGTPRYRYVRVTITDATNGHPASLSQLEVLVDD
jgi:hypothetical protein